LELLTDGFLPILHLLTPSKGKISLNGNALEVNTIEDVVFLPNPHIKLIIDDLCGRIAMGFDLSSSDMQAIIALIKRETDEIVIENYEGKIASNDVATGVDGYKPIRVAGRPTGDANIVRDSAIAEDFHELRKNHKYDDVLEILSKKSLKSYGRTLDYDRIKSCIIRGNKYLTEHEKYISSDEFSDVIDCLAGKNK